MAPSAEFGIDGIKLHSGDHVCGLFFGWYDRDELMVPFFRTGLRAGDRCVVVTDRTDPSPVLRDLGTADETERWLASGQLQLRTSVDQPEPAGPSLHHEEMLAMWGWAAAIDDSPSGSGFSRLGGEVSWWTQAASAGELARYEVELNRNIGDHMAVLCLYDLSRLSAEAVINAVLTHPVVLVGDRIVDNPWYVTPEEHDALEDHDSPGRARPTMQDIGDMVNQRAPTVHRSRADPTPLTRPAQQGRQVRAAPPGRQR